LSSWSTPNLAKTLDVAIRAVDGPDLADGMAKFRRNAEDGHIESSPYYVALAWNFAYEMIARDRMKSPFPMTASCWI
jgi:hypothetical protein